MRKECYDARQKALDLLRRHSDPGVADNSNFRAEGVMTHDTQMGSNPTSAMIVPLPMDEENMAKLLPFNSNDNKLYQLVDHTDTKQKVPNIKSLDFSKNEDGQELSPSVVCDTEEHKNLPFFKGDDFGSETVKNLILKFLKQYYWIYDYGDRQGLLDAYHSEACFSLFIPFNPQDPASSLATYFRYSRNMKTCKDPNLRAHLLKHTKHDIVDFLSVLPRTQHDLSSFLVDVCVQTEKMLCFSVNGLFKE
ncbi:PREDICTED: nuclear RNA export factor 3-like, partial [Chrysochloris asiatica]|uniref:Nuclear RNA export factor 3-like n=1 Tax=Chrysochloris asiatica TaxID=185453 RepID=A0A9B0UD08_CHRAS